MSWNPNDITKVHVLRVSFGAFRSYAEMDRRLARLRSQGWSAAYPTVGPVNCYTFWLIKPMEGPK